MTISNFARIVSMREGKKQQVSIAQILEILRVVNTETGGELYKKIRTL